MNYKSKEIELLKDVKKQFEYIRTVVIKYKHLVRITHDDNLKIVVKDLDIDSKFHFTIQNPVYEKSFSFYNLTYNPQGTQKPNEYSSKYSSNGGTIEKLFSNWISYLQFFDSLKIHPTDSILKDYKERFQKAFIFLDEENDDKALTFENQVQLKELLNKTIEFVNSNEALDNDENLKNEIINELQYLNKSVPQLTQGQIKNSFSIIYAKIYFKGVDIINWITSQGSSVGFGYLLIEGVKKALS